MAIFSYSSYSKTAKDRMSLIGEENVKKIDLKQNSVEEVRLKKRRDANKAYAERISYAIKRKREEKKRKEKEERFLTPEKLLKLNKERRHDRKRFNRQDKRMRTRNLRPVVSSNLLVICRTCPCVDASKGTMAILKELNITPDHAAIFVRNSDEMIRKLTLIAPYVAWGKPDKTTVDELLTKHAYTIIDGKRVPVSDNVMVEDHLGDKDVICIADMQNEISNVGPAFDDVCKFLAPFELKSGLTDVEHRMLHMNSIPHGDQGDNVNSIIKSML